MFLQPSGDFLGFIVSGDINVNPGIGDSAVASPTPGNADLVGAFLANGNFQGGSTASQTDKQLVIYGTVGADIDLNGSGRVRFQILNFPSQLTDALTDWREVAPQKIS